MAKRSLKASAMGIARAKQAFQRREWTQEYLASAVGLQTRQSIWKFFSGRPIERHLFIDICFQLDLDWQDIAELPQFDQPDAIALPAQGGDGGSPPTSTTLDSWVQQVRSHQNSRIQEQCGTLQIALDMAHPLSLSQVYTDVQLLPHLTSQRWLEVADLQPQIRAGERLLLPRWHPATISGLEAVQEHSRLMILGKPGSGKTTFLQYLALHCQAGQVWGDRIPVFIPLRTVAPTGDTQDLHLNDLHLGHRIGQQWAEAGLSAEQTAALLAAGRIVVLLDGLDEVSAAERSLVQQCIQTFADTYPSAQLVLTCRLAAQDYHFRGFTCMEMADFDPAHIEIFVQQWFTAVSSGDFERAQVKASQFLEQLQWPENQLIQELVATPLLLHLACLVFCEREAFPRKQSRFFQSALDILLVRWDNAKGIQRDRLTCHLSLSDWMNILSQIAATFVEQGKYVFEKAKLLAIIAAYLMSLPGETADPESVWLQSEEVLRAIALHYGLLVERARDIYSFSHLALQDYLTARKLFVTTLANQSARISMTATNSVPSSLILYQSKHRFVASCGHRVMALMAELLPDLHGLFQHNFEEIWNFNPSRQLQNQHYCQTNAFLTTCLQESLQVSPELQPDLESNSSASVLTAAFASLQSSSL